jgi:hypothetical protein
MAEAQAQAQIYKIYKITSPQTDKIYIGSTKQTLNIRFSKHKSKTNNTGSRSIVEYKDATIELIEEVDVDQRYIRERYWVEFYGNLCVNKLVPGRTMKEYKQVYYIENKEYILSRGKLNYELHKDERLATNKKWIEEHLDQYEENRKEIITCECGGKTTRSNISRHNKSKRHLKFVEAITMAISSPPHYLTT